MLEETLQWPVLAASEYSWRHPGNLTDEGGLYQWWGLQANLSSSTANDNLAPSRLFRDAAAAEAERCQRFCVFSPSGLARMCSFDSTVLHDHPCSLPPSNFTLVVCISPEYHSKPCR